MLLRAQLLERARDDERIVAAAVTGSGARDGEDRWSDIDLFFGVSPGAAIQRTLKDWTAFAYLELGALHHFDLHAGPAVYRAFLLAELAEIDLGFTPAAAFGPIGTGPFRVVFGDAMPRRPVSVDLALLVGNGWHHTLHARICIERGDFWQAEYWISGIRDATLALACLRLGLPVDYAKGADQLPADITNLAQEALVHGLGADELSHALGAAAHALVRELRETDSRLADTLEKPLLVLASVSAAS